MAHHPPQALLMAIGLSFLVACSPSPTPPPPTLTPTPSPTPAPALPPSSPHLPDADPYDLARRLRGLTDIPGITPSPGYTPGHHQDFSVVDMEKELPFTVTAVLRQVTPHAYFYFQEGMEPSAEALEQASRRFEDILDRVLQEFGLEWRPGPDGDDHITLLHARIPGVAGYFSSPDNYPRAVQPASNERLMVYINTGALRLGTPGYYSVLAHELQHLVHWWADPNEETWVGEGLSEWMMDRLGYPPSTSSFTHQPDISLVNWPVGLSGTIPHYEAAYLFFKYLLSNFATTPGLRDLVTQPEDGIAGIQAYLTSQGQPISFDEVFARWIAANYLDQLPSIDTYPKRRLITTPSQQVDRPGSYQATVNPYAADYIEVRLSGDITINFQGKKAMPILPTQPPSGRYLWWSNRGDSVDTTLTREFDLRGVTRATLSFRLWHHLEAGWDYGYVAVSTDQGQRWTLLSGQHTTTQNPLGNSYGPGYTGISGSGTQPEWVEETMDLSPYAGRRIWLRFEQVTDDAINAPGLAVDDISIPEVGFFDDVEAERGWSAQGFLRSQNLAETRFEVQLIEVGPQPRVRPVPLDTSNQGHIEVRGLGDDIEYVVLAVAALAPFTHQEVSYQFTISDGGNTP